MASIFRTSALLLGATALAMPALAFAQARTVEAVSGEIRTYQGTAGAQPAEFAVAIPAGSVMTIDVLATSDIDPVLTVTDADTGEVLAEDDDGGEDLNSRARIRGEDGRRVLISVGSFDADWAEEGEAVGGTFDLQLETRAYVPVATRSVTYGSRMTGTVEQEENLFTFAGSAGDTMEVALLADGEDDFDPYLVLRDEDGAEIATNDDGGVGLNSYLSYTFPADGTVTILATGFGDSTGDYTLRVRERREQVSQLPQQVIGLGDSVSGELVSDWNEQGLGLTHIDYRLSDAAKAAIRSGAGGITVRMDAGEGGDADFGGAIDPYLELGFETPLGFAVVDSDDDGAGSLDALLPVDLSRIAERPELLDELRIRAKGMGGSGGAYTLSVTEGLQQRVEPEWEAAVDEVEEAID